MMINVVRPILASAAALAGGLILFGLLSDWLAPADSVAHFRFHLTALMISLTLALAVMRDWRRAGLAALLSLIGAASMAPVLGPWPAPVLAEDRQAVNLVQLNLSFRNRTPEAVAAFIRAADADIVTLQEVTARTGRVIDLLAGDYPALIRCPFEGVGGVAVLSRLPRAAGGDQGCVEGKGLAWLRLDIGGREVSVASVHLHWPWPFGQNRQIDDLQGEFAAIPRPVMLAGDFNAAPWSHSVERVGLAIGSSVAPGLRFSYDIGYVGSWMPMLPVPIDHILLPGDIAPLDVRLGPGPGSDHRSIVARLSLPTVPEDRLARK